MWFAQQGQFLRQVRQVLPHVLLYAVSVLVLVLDERGRLVVSLRGAGQPWDVFGGPKELDEDFRACAERHLAVQFQAGLALESLLGLYTHPRYTFTASEGGWIQPWALALCYHWAGSGDLPVGLALYRPEGLPPHPLPLYEALRQALSTGGASLEAPYRAEKTRPFFPLLRQFIKPDPLILPGALMLVRDATGRVLVTQRAELGGWDLPGGFSDLGESVAYTALREVREETGLDVTPTRLLGLYSDPRTMWGQYPNGDIVHPVGALFEGRILGGKMRPDGAETAAVAFFLPEDLLAMPDLRPLTRHILNDLSMGGSPPFLH